MSVMETVIYRLDYMSSEFDDEDEPPDLEQQAQLAVPFFVSFGHRSSLRSLHSQPLLLVRDLTPNNKYLSRRPKFCQSIQCVYTEYGYKLIIGI